MPKFFLSLLDETLRPGIARGDSVDLRVIMPRFFVSVVRPTAIPSDCKDLRVTD